MLIRPTRRQFVSGVASLLCAPAIVRATNLMAIKPWHEPTWVIQEIQASSDGVNWFTVENEIVTFAELGKQPLRVFGLTPASKQNVAYRSIVKPMPPSNLRLTA